MTIKQFDFSHYQIPIDFIPLNVVVYRHDGDDFIFIDVNKQAEKTEGVKKEALLGKKLCDVFPAIKEFGLYAVLLRVYEHGEHETFDDAYYQDTHTSGWRKNEIIRLPNGDVMAIYEDLTQVKKLEEENDKHLQQLQLLGKIVDKNMNEVFMFDPDTLLFSYVNLAAQKNIGYTHEELMFMTPVDIKPEYTLETFLPLLEQIHTGEKTDVVFETLHRRKNGSNYTAEIHLQLIEIEDKKHFVVFVHDITERKHTQLQLEESKEKLKMLAQAIEQTDDLVKIVNTKGEIVFVNDSMIVHSGYTRSELIGEHTRKFKSGHHDKLFYAKLWNTVSSGKNFRDTFVNKSKNGNTFYEEMTITPILDTNGKVEYFVSTGKDISKRVELEHALHDAEELYHTLFDLSPTGILVIDAQTGKAVEFNRISHEALGYTADEFTEITIGDYEAHEAAEDTAKHIEELKKGNLEVFETQHRTKDGAILDVIVTVQLIVIKDKPYLFAAYHNVTSLKQYERALEIAKQNVESANKSLIQQAKLLEEYAFLDPLTHLSNRRKFEKVYDAEWRRASRNNQSLSICMIDIDFFKGYNDALGHDEGDGCLQMVASAINKSCSRSGELVARFGGEEFIVLLPHCDEKNAYRSSENIRRAVEDLGIKHPNSKVSSVVTVSIGCATCYLPDKTLDKKSLIKRADEALYKAKANGRNRVDTIGENTFSEIKIMEDFTVS